MKSYVLILGILLLSLEASARVFDFSSQTVSTYLRVSGAPTALQRGAYAPGFPTNVTFTDSNGVSMLYSAEIGFSFTTPSSYNFRVGVEGLLPYSSGGSTGAVNNVSQFTVVSTAYAIIPQANFELFLKKKPNFRLYLGLGGGYALVSFQNNVNFTSTSTYNLGNYIEEGSTWAPMGQGYIGFEFPAFDNVGFSLDIGYRYLQATGFTTSQGYTSPIKTVTQGGAIVNNDGSNRTINLSGPFAAFNFRFYFN